MDDHLSSELSAEFNSNSVNTSTGNRTAMNKTTVAWPVKSLDMIAPHHPMQNRLLAALPAHEFSRLLPHLELVPMPFGKIVYESGSKLQHLYFPTTCILSMLYVLADGGSSEIAVVGNEGVLGVSLLMGGETTPSRAMARSSGFAYRVKAQIVKREFNQVGIFMQLLLRYTQALMVQVSQTAVCNRYHTVEQQLCRCLLLSHDRLPTNSLAMTQELISSILGVRREGVTEAAGKLQRAGYISYSRGRINVMNRLGLEAKVCECYLVVKTEYDRLIPNTQHAMPANIN